MQRSGKRTFRLNSRNDDNLSQDESVQAREEIVQEEQEQEQFCSYFSKSKKQIQDLQREMIPTYLEYRKLLVDSLKEICQETGITNFNVSSVEMSAQRTKQLASLSANPKQEERQDMQELLDKIMKQRQIKRYYAYQLQDNQRVQLDQENDQELVYQIYREAFGITENNRTSNPILALSNSQEQINNSTQHVKPTVSRIVDTNNYSNLSINKKINKQQSPKNQTNVLQGLNMQMGMEHEYSFDQNNQQYFSGEKVAYDQRQQVLSETNYDAFKTKKSGLRNRQEDRLSHTEDVYKNFVLKQQQQLIKQKQRVQRLSDTANKVINNEIAFQDANDKEVKTQEDYLSQLRNLLGEAVELFAAGQCLKFQLKFRSYELLDKLYANASAYYNENISVEQPINVKHFCQILKAVMPEDEQFVRLSIANIFGTASEISYEEFMQHLSPKINEKQFELLDGSKAQKTFDMTVKLFVLWTQIQYFQREIHRLLGSNDAAVAKFIELVAEKATLSPILLADFITRGKANRVSKLKAELYFKSIVGASLSVKGFLQWVKVHEFKVNPKFQQQQQQDKYQYYYGLG